MNKTETVKVVANKVPEMTRAQVKRVLDALGEVAVEELNKGKSFAIPGLVKLRVVTTRERPERLGRNPSTGDQITIPAKTEGKKLKARFAKSLKIEVGALKDE
jgi:nucleoid DNA-binding protein